MNGSERTARYAELWRYARSIAESIIRDAHPPGTARALQIHRAALSLHHAPERAAPQGGVPRTAAHDVLDILAKEWPRLATGRLDGADLMRARPGLWRRLMTEWPMMEYADLLLETLEKPGAEPTSILEVGCGVGNTTARLATRYGARLVWSDREPSLVRPHRWPGQGRVFDFDADPPSDLGPFTVVVATNALHCAADVNRTLSRIRRLLEPGGTLLMAEGSSPTRADGTPWALDLLFSAFDGWWNRSGFLTRAEWTDALTAQGFTDIGFTALKAGEDDLGGVMWATEGAHHD
ncbi:class I SAM-dependent methyltransferase [Streptosporangium sandarakinum]|uniref:class I SAM-dependent methyltransferase n=1 Tax=Streptosporangium sandarakinum TaxID=1260955 RepID=UPI003423C186